jgi:2-polyprenyl-3-methyl-5-hydroxy-6-metoxy-1,4-benzoquinol methylase
VAGKSVLDIGCGSGRYSIALAKKGARVLGIDFAAKMIGLAQNFSEASGKNNLCDFVTGDFLDYQFNNKFDACLAIGFFDYIKEPVKYLTKIKSLTREKAVISFPAKWHLRNIIRRIRLKILGCPVYFYSKFDIEKILRDSGFLDFSIKNIGRDYFVVIKS